MNLGTSGTQDVAIVRGCHVTKALEFAAGLPETLAVIDGYDDIPVFHGIS